MGKFFVKGGRVKGGRSVIVFCSYDAEDWGLASTQEDQRLAHLLTSVISSLPSAGYPRTFVTDVLEFYLHIFQRVGCSTDEAKKKVDEVLEQIYGDTKCK